MAGQFVNPSSSLPEVQSIISDATQIVTDRFAEAMSYADGAYNDVASFLNALQSAADSYGGSMVFLNPIFPDPVSPFFNLGDAPVKPEVEIYLPEFPVYPVLRSLSLLTGIQTDLESRRAIGGTGLNPAVENEIWWREEERSRIALAEAKEKIVAEWSQRGFAVPDGVIVSQLTQMDVEYANKRTDLSRDIAIKQYELAFQNTQFIIQQVLAMETLVLNATSQANEVSIRGYMAEIDGYKSKIQAAIGRLEAQIKAYEGEGNVYRARADAQAAIAGVDIKAAEAEINMAIAQMQLFLKQTELNMKNSEVRAQLRVAAADAGGKIAAALASGIFSGVSVQAQISGSGSAQKQYSGQESLSESYPHKEIT